jgi:hypothetical protein
MEQLRAREYHFEDVLFALPVNGLLQAMETAVMLSIASLQYILVLLEHVFAQLGMEGV